MSSRPPRSILLVLHVESLSGPQLSLNPRLKLLRDEDAEVSTLLPRHGPAAAPAAEVGEVRSGVPGSILMPRSPADLARAIGAIRKQAAITENVARELGADLVVVTSPRMIGAMSGAMRAGSAVLLYGGELLPAGGAGRTGSWALRRSARGRADSIVAPSRAAAAQYEARGAPVHVVNPVIGPRATPGNGPAFRERHGIDRDEPIVSTLGAITRGRGQDLAVRALAASPEAAWRLVIAGEPYERRSDLRFAEDLRRLTSALGLGGRVVFTGRLDDPADMFAASDVFLNPARVPESFGRAACEALLAACPVVSTAAGGVGEALAGGGAVLLDDPSDVAAMTAAIDTLLADPDEARSLASRGASQVRRRFAPPAGDDAWREAVEAALEAARRRR